MGNLSQQGALWEGVKTSPQKILTDSRFPGTTELLSAASVEQDFSWGLPCCLYAWTHRPAARSARPLGYVVRGVRSSGEGGV